MEREIAKGLLSIGAVFLRPEQPFTWASGIKSPIYCDNRLILTAPEVRKKVEAAIAETVKAKFPACEVDFFKNLCPLDFMVTERLNLLKSSCRLLSHNSVCVYKSKERYGRGKSLSTLHFYCPPN